VNLKVVRELRQYGRGEVLIYVVTLVTIVATDLLTGVLTGIGLSAVKLLYGFSHLDIRVKREPERGATVMYLDGAATFIRLPKLAAALDQVPPSSELHVHIERLRYVDHACLDLLMNWEKQHEATGGQLVIDWEQFTARFQSPAPARNPSAVRETVPANGRELEPVS
jgi:MFS superfamily sulfate permease-like transporter